MATKKISELAELLNAIAAGDEFVINNDSITKKVKASLLADSLVKIFAENGGAGLHNSLYRGKYIGSSVTAAQKSQIQAGSFDDMWVGDYWNINGVTWRIAHFDYWLRTGDTECTSHHVLIVSDACLGYAKMNDENTTDGAYIGSKMYTENLADAKATIRNAFGSGNILTHRELLANVTSDGKASSWSWYDSDIELMNESMVYGSPVNSKPIDSSANFNVGIDKTQLALFRLAPQFITNRANWWLRCVVSSASFAYVTNYGNANYYYASYTLGVRPVFAIK